MILAFTSGAFFGALITVVTLSCLALGGRQDDLTDWWADEEDEYWGSAL